MKSLKVFFLILVTLSGLSACENASNSSTKLSPNTPPKRKTEKIRNIATPRIDILFVVDDSGSMGDHQDNLSVNIDLFINEIRNFGFLDYRIGVTSSSLTWGNDNKPGKNGNLIGFPNYVDRNTPNGENLLRQRIKVGTNGSITEVFLETVQKAFSANATANTNAGFYRSNAYVAVFFITDAEDQGKVSAKELFDELVTMKRGDANKVLSYGAIIPQGSRSGCSRDDDNAPPLKIEEFINLTKGAFFDLCDADYGTKLASVAKDLAERVARVIYLSERPKVESIRVNYGTQEIPNHPKAGWMYNAQTNAIMLGEDLELSAQPEGTDLDVTFVPAEDIVSGGGGR